MGGGDDVDLIGTPIERIDADAVFEAQEDATNAPRIRLPECFEMKPDGLYYEDDKGVRLIGGRFWIICHTRNYTGENHGIDIGFVDCDRIYHRVNLPFRELRSPTKPIQRLADKGLYVAHNVERLIAKALIEAQVPPKSRRVSRIGWQSQSVFVLPTQTFGVVGEEVRIDDAIDRDTGFDAAGTLDDWKAGPAALASGNNILMFGVMVALAGPTIEPATGENSIFHLRGASSIGKTTAAKLASSVWGKPTPDGFFRSWRTTTNAMEILLRSRCDTFLSLDELQMAAPKDVADAAYMISSGTGKERMTSDLRKAETSKWRVLVLSTGEVSLATHLRTDNRKVTGGQLVRLVDIPADAGCGMGVFEALNGTTSANELSKNIAQSSQRDYGTAGPAFVKALAWYVDRGARQLRDARKKFEDQECPEGASGQVRRVCAQFGFVAAAGAFAAAEGIVPWTVADAVDAAAFCFRAWLTERGHADSHELKTEIEALRNEILRQEPLSISPWSGLLKAPKLGYRRAGPSAVSGIYLFTRVVDDMLKHTDKRAVLGEILRKGWLRTTNPRRLTVLLREPVNDRVTRFYHFTSEFLEADALEPEPTSECGAPQVTE